MIYRKRSRDIPLSNSVSESFSAGATNDIRSDAHADRVLAVCGEKITSAPVSVTSFLTAPGSTSAFRPLPLVACNSFLRPADTALPIARVVRVR